MRKYFILAALVAITTTAVANEGTKANKTSWRANLTEQQKSCIENHGCPQFSKEERKNKTEAELSAGRECKMKAFEACGVQRPERKDGERMKNKNKSE